ncbi:hypothetical protein GUJ93_ZPchr0001g30597 [Zizania palustris]|uniref:Uncharacterized protein n=1 Tax=Zizania palustris TaxID=103762 RepID=A0A8J5VNU5_ZIZPA|nr:hypothetical protein GUJ93_ZPchr0001g30597 [Zizania palustris]
MQTSILVVTTGKITGHDRMCASREMQQAAFQKKMHPFFRAVDKHDCIYADIVNIPIKRKIEKKREASLS